MSPIEQECLDSLIQKKIHIQQNLNEGLNYLYIKVLKELCHSKLSDLHLFDNMAIIHCAKDSLKTEG